MSKRIQLIFVGVLCSVLSTQILQSQEISDARNLVENLYEMVSFEPENPPDWDRVKAMFIDEAVVILRTSRTELTQFTVDGFVNDFKHFAENEKVKSNGFQEIIIDLKETVFGDIAHCFVIYEASFPGLDYPPQKGFDSFQLVNREDGWKIVSIINEIPSKGNPLPDLRYD